MAGGGQGAGPTQGGQIPTGYADGGMVQSGYNNFASPNFQGFMQYQGQGQPNQPNQPPTIGATPQNQNFMQGVDATGNAPSTNMGFDGSGSDGGVAGQPAPMQGPFAQGNKPLGLAQFQQPQGLQIQGNPTSQVVQRPQQR